MNKWLILLAAAAITGGSYYLLSQAKEKRGESPAPTSAVDVEEFDTPEDSTDTDKSDVPFDMVDDPDAPQGAPGGADQKAASRPSGNAADVETIDDSDDPGETVKDPVTLEEKSSTVDTPTAR